MYIVFADSSMSYDGVTPEHHPLGGSQSALVYLTKALVKLGARVKVYNQCKRPGDYEGVQYRRWFDLFLEGHQQKPDFFVSLRDPKLESAWKGTGKKVLWCQDWYNQPCLSGLNGATDHVFFVGRWQLNEFCEGMLWPREKAWVVPNGVPSEFYNTEDHYFREGQRLVYTSTPFRGVEHLINIYPKIRERVRGATLHLYGGMGVYQDYTHEADTVYKQFENMDGVIIHGPIGQRKLASELEKARIFAYPNTFPETCCISALEAMAGGCIPITSYRAGLIETVGSNGVLIHGEPGTPEYDNRFVDECEYFLTNDNAWALESRKAWAWAHNERNYRALAQVWLDNFDLILRG